MKKMYSLLLMALFTNLSLCSQNISFEDAKFKEVLIHSSSKIDTNTDGEISEEEAENFTGSLGLDNKKIKSLKGLEYFINITGLDCARNELTKLDVLKNTALMYLDVSSNKLKNIDVSKNTSLIHLNVYNNKLKNIDVLNNTSLTHLSVYENQLTRLDVSANIALTHLGTYDNQLTNIDLSKNIALTHLGTYDNQLTNIDLSKNIALTHLGTYDNQITNIDLSKNEELTHLIVGDNKLTNLDVTKNTSLTSLSVYDSKLTSLDLSKHTLLTHLQIHRNQLTDLNLSKNIDSTIFVYLSIKSNKLTNLDISKKIGLEQLHVYENQLTNIDLSKNVNLTRLGVGSNQLTALDLSKNSELIQLNVDENQLTNIDLSNCNLEDLSIQNCSELRTLNLIDQDLDEKLVVKNNPKLDIVCAKSDKVDYIESKLENSGNGAYKLSTDCTKKTLNIITGVVSYAQNLGLCGTPNLKSFSELQLKIKLSNGDKKEITPDTSGNYRVFLPKGKYSVDVELSKKNYFNYIPKPIGSIEFKGEGETKIKNICVTPKGKFDDLAISVSGGKAKPGFKVTYTLTYKNIGTTTLSGTVKFKIKEPTKQRCISSSTPRNTDTSAEMTWDFKDLKPAESKIIMLIFEINKPTDVPAVNGGEELNYTATITDTNRVEKATTSDDNISELTQEVKSSWDPNDKTCIEGSILRLKNVGKYLTYMIRFENKGTAEATNVRVEDVIDPTKFDIKSLRYISSGNHLCVTEVEDDTVNFNFKDINLGFSLSDNKGYVLFKIKTLASLKEGDEIKNKASIFFDFNKPVITETETVVVKKKVDKKLKFSDYFMLTPNRTKGSADLIEKKSGLKIRFFTINDSHGDMLAYDPARTRHFDFWYLTTGKTYYLRVFTENNGILSTRFIKE